MQNDVHKPNYIYRQTIPIPEDTPKVRGYDFNRGVDHQALLQSFYNTGFQATSFGLAVNQINMMVRRMGSSLKVLHSSCMPSKQNLTNSLSLSSPQIEKRKEALGADNKSVEGHSSGCPCQNNCTIFLGYTSNLISSGVRESIRFLTQHKMVQFSPYLFIWQKFCTLMYCITPSCQGWCVSDHSWRHRGGLDQVSGPFLLGRFLAFGQGSV